MPETVIRVPFVHAAKVRRPRGRNAQETLYLSHVDVSLRAMPADAPVVFRHQPWRHDAPVDHRWHDGGLWKPLATSDRSGEPETARGLEWLAARIAVPTGNGPLGAGSAFDRWGREAPVPLADDRAVAEVLSSAEDAVRREIEGRASRLAVLDGMLWTSTPEPVLALGWMDGRPYLSVEVPARIGADTFRLDQGDLPAMLRPGLDGRVDAPLGGLEVLRPDLLRRDVTGHVMLSTANQARDAAGARALARDVAYFQAYAALRDACAALSATLDRGDGPAGLTDVCEALLGVREAGRPFGDDPSGQADVDEALARVAHERSDVDADIAASFHTGASP